MKIFKRLRLAFTYPDELDIMLEGIRANTKEAKRLMELDYLDLCIRHQQRNIGSHYAEHNCDYCKLLKE